MFEIDPASSELTPGDILNIHEIQSKDQLFNRLYTYLYGICNKNEVNRLIILSHKNECPGFCTNKWMEETVAIKCYECEYDSTCAVCLDCFFNSDHTGHEFRLTRTSGGCCDCGDVSSWDVKGSCSVHNQSINYHERSTLEMFTASFLSRLEGLLNYLINYVSACLREINVISSESLQLVVLFINDLVDSSPSYRYAMHLLLSNDDLKNWMLKHQILHNNLQKAFNSLYLTMLTSMSFKRKFSYLFASIYADVVQPLKEIPDEWHLSNLSVQLFTYSNIALDLVTSSFLKTCIDPVIDRSLTDKRLKTLQFPRFDRKKFSLYIRIISDLTYLINHTAVCSLVLADERLHETIFTLFAFHNYMNAIEREAKNHVTFENTGYSITFTIEHSLHNAFKPFSDYIKSIDASRVPELIRLYKNYNDFVKRLGLDVRFDSDKLVRSFHIPLVRLFSFIVDFNFVRSCVKAHLSQLSSEDPYTSEYIHEYFPSLLSERSLTHRVLDVFDSEVLNYLLRASVDVLKFAAEIKQTLWVYNGETMHDQRNNYYDLHFHTLDIATVQTVVVLLGMKGLETDQDIVSHLFDLCIDIDNIDLSVPEPIEKPLEFTHNEDMEDRSIMEINDVVHRLFADADSSGENDLTMEVLESNASETEDLVMDLCEDPPSNDDPGSLEFKLSFFYTLLNSIICDVKHLEIVSLSKKTAKDDFVRRGYPLLKMDIIYALTSGNTEFGQVVNETKKHWKHHPMLIETIEEVAMFNYSKVSDKTYVRLKPDSLEKIDILWNIQQPITHISKESLSHDLSLIGVTDGSLMSSEYEETQNLILNSIRCSSLFDYLVYMFSSFCNIGFELEDGSVRSLPDLYNMQSNSEALSRIKRLLTSSFKFNSCSQSVLCGIKLFNLLLSKLPKPSNQIAESILNAFEEMVKVMDDEIYKKATSFTIKRLISLYSFASRETSAVALPPAKDIKSIQKQFMQRLSTQQSLFTKELDDLDISTDLSEETVCVLCKQVLDASTQTSMMAFISTNNVLRRCADTSGSLTHRVNAISSFPLRSSIISSCGHMAHSPCIMKHRKTQSDKQLFMVYGIQRLISEFFCPMCKSLCNYAINVLPGQDMKSPMSIQIFNDLNGDNLSKYRAEIQAVDEILESNSDELSIDSLLLVGDNLMLNEINRLTAYSWRYQYSTCWIPSPVYAKNDKYPQTLYAISGLLSSKTVSYYAPSTKDSLQDLVESSRGSDRSLDCSYCSKFDLDTDDIDGFNCPSFAVQENVLLPVPNQIDAKHVKRVDALLEFMMRDWEDFKNSDVFGVIAAKVVNLDITESFPRLFSTSYSKSLFAHRRTYFGVQNWRHVNSTVRMDAKFWLLYNEVLNTCSYRRNSLTLKNPLYAQLVRNFCLYSVNNEFKRRVGHLDSVLQDNVLLDEFYHDLEDESPVLPDVSLYGDGALALDTSLLRIIVESIPDEDLEDLMRELKLKASKRGSKASESGTPARVLDFFATVQSSSHDLSSIRSIKPLNHYLYSASGRMDVYKMFANDLPINPWSLDFVREFLQDFLSPQARELSQVLERLHYYLVVAVLQVLDRFFMEALQCSYVDFIDLCSSRNQACLRTRQKRDFMLAYMGRFFSDFFENGEFPCDVMTRLMLTDFHKNLEMFRVFNATGSESGRTPKWKTASPVWPENLRPDYATFNRIMQETITYASMMRSVHDAHVEAFTEPIPHLSKTAPGSPGFDEADLDEYLVNQVSRILKVREIHNNMDLKIDADELATVLRGSRSEAMSPKRHRMVDNPTVERTSATSIFTNPDQGKSLSPKHVCMYKGVDFARRINTLLYKSHCSTPFFEALRHNIPSSIHTLDFIASDFVNGLDEAVFALPGGFVDTVEALFNYQASYLVSKGYLSRQTKFDFGGFKTVLFESVNLFLDVAFWTIKSVFPFDDELCTRVSYSNLYEPEKRFVTLFEALDLESVADAASTSQYVRHMFSSTFRNQMVLNRLCNMEVTPPIVSKYKLLDIDRHLDEMNWGVIRSSAFRNCANCGIKPANPLLCLLCGSLLCSNNECCHKPKLSSEAKFIASLERKNIGFRKSDIACLYEEEMLAHAKVCGGGQSVFLSPYHCCVLLVDDRRRCVIPSVYSDKYGNSDLHGKVYGDVCLSRVRLDNIVNTYCSGRLSNEIVSHRKQLFTYFI